MDYREDIIIVVGANCIGDSLHDTWLRLQGMKGFFYNKGFKPEETIGKDGGIEELCLVVQCKDISIGELHLLTAPIFTKYGQESVLVIHEGGEWCSLWFDICEGLVSTQWIGELRPLSREEVCYAPDWFLYRGKYLLAEKARGC